MTLDSLKESAALRGRDKDLIIDKVGSDCRRHGKKKKDGVLVTEIFCCIVSAIQH